MNTNVTIESINSNVPNDGPYLSRKELAPLLKKSVRTIDTWVALGILPVIKIGRSILFCWPDVQRALAKYQQKGRML